MVPIATTGRISTWRVLRGQTTWGMLSVVAISEHPLTMNSSTRVNKCRLWWWTVYIPWRARCRYRLGLVGTVSREDRGLCRYVWKSVI
jgi:hypothetical protein